MSVSMKKKPVGSSHLPSVTWMAERVEPRPLDQLRPYTRQNRTHGARNIGKLKDAIARFGFVVPILIEADGTIIAGHGRWEAAKALGLGSVPVVVVDHLSPGEVRALRIADNRLAELSEWNREALRLEFADLSELVLEGSFDLDLTITGFETAEIDLILLEDAESAAATEPETVEPPDRARPAVTRPGDLWLLGSHRILCADALAPESHRLLLGGEEAAMVFTDPPYNVPVNGHVRSGGAAQHREFAMASGEMSDAEFRKFLGTCLERMIEALPAGGVAMVCMDWRHIEELIACGKAAGFELINLCVWNKTNGGMGSLYRSKHELVAIFRKPGAGHVNNVELGRHGRNRTNVWDYAGVNSFGRGREADLADHPTVKPTALVADAMLDVTNLGDVVLDCFGGSGATLLAAERTGRRARLIELDPVYVDVSIHRWQTATGQKAIHASTGEAFDDRAAAVAAALAEDAPQAMEADHVDA